MSNFWFNIRFGTYHWQWGPDGMSWHQNPAHIAWRNEKPDSWKWFAIYDFFGISFSSY
jgi:hypothetical protein